MNVLLITSEDNGPHFGCYGDTTVPTPHLDQLAADGICFDNAYVTQSVCSPSRASILTGLYPHQNGQIGLATHAFSMWDENIPTLPAILNDAGYRTGRIGKLHVSPEAASPFQFVWNDPAFISFNHRDVRKTAEVAGDFFRDAGNRPFLLMVNYADAHLPWLRQDCGLPKEPALPGQVKTPPAVGLDSGRLRQHTADYYSCLSRLDTGIGLLLDQLADTGHAEDTLVIYLADHGPQFSRGKCAVYELALKVPFLIRWPGAGANRRSAQLVSAIDIVPTILDALGLPSRPELPGRSLRPLVHGHSVPWRESLCCEWTSSHPSPAPSFLYPQRTIRDARYKLIKTLVPEEPNPVEEYYTKHVLIDTGTTQWEIDHAPPSVQSLYRLWRQPPPCELYDLREDPHEFNNLADSATHRHIHDRLLQQLGDWQEQTGDSLRHPHLLRRLLDDDRRVAQSPGMHRQPDFRWPYLDYLRPPRA